MLITISVILDSISRNRKISVPVRAFKVSPFSCIVSEMNFFIPATRIGTFICMQSRRISVMIMHS